MQFTTSRKVDKWVEEHVKIYQTHGTLTVSIIIEHI